MTKYGIVWREDMDELQIEFACIRYGGRWRSKTTGEMKGKGLFHHYKEAMTLMWPDHDWHRWAELSLKSIVENRYITFLGCQNSGKTWGAAKFALTDYFIKPENTLALISSTDIRGLELRVWGAIKAMHRDAKDKWPWIPGTIVDYLHAITTDSLEDADGKKGGRDLRKGLICIPCLSGGKYVGLGKYVGIKQGRVRFVADEMQAMAPSFLDAISNIGGNPDFKFIGCGNPTDPLDPLGQAAEPKLGWSKHPEPTKTEVWETRFKDGVCVNFVGTDSPNFDYSQNRPPKYPYLIHKKRMDEVADFWGRESARFAEQCLGVMKTGLLQRRIITADLCREHGALEKVIWQGNPLTKVYACDAAYSGVGGDRCVAGHIEFGEAITGQQIIRVRPPKIVPISIESTRSPEDQIADYIAEDCETEKIDPDHVFYDSTGRGTLGISLARAFAHLSKFPVPIEFGGRPSQRPVRYDLFTIDGDEKRHVRCDEYYVDKVSELWMTSRYLIECGQMRELPEDVMDEGCQREYGIWNNKTFVESKHDPKARERMKVSPDLYDWLVTAIEGAKRLGFKIQKVGLTFTEQAMDDDFAERENRAFNRIIQSALPSRSTSVGVLTHR